MLSGCSRGLEQRRAWTNREREVSMAGDFGILWQKDDAIIYIYISYCKSSLAALSPEFRMLKARHHVRSVEGNGLCSPCCV